MVQVVRGPRVVPHKFLVHFRIEVLLFPCRLEAETSYRQALLQSANDRQDVGDDGHRIAIDLNMRVLLVEKVALLAYD